MYGIVAEQFRVLQKLFKEQLLIQSTLCSPLHSKRAGAAADVVWCYFFDSSALCSREQDHSWSNRAVARSLGTSIKRHGYSAPVR